MLGHFESRNPFIEQTPTLSKRPRWSWPLPAPGGSRNGRYAWGLVALWTAALILWFLYRGLLRPAWVNQISDPLFELLTLLEAGSLFTLIALWSLLTWRQMRGREAAGDQGAPIVALTAAEMYGLSPADFEKYTAALFRQKGFRVKVRGRSGDSGVDLDIRGRDGRKAVAQCKRYNKTVGAEIVRELFGTMIHERASHAFLITTAAISSAARDWAHGKPITLIDGKALEQIASSLEERFD